MKEKQKIIDEWFDGCKDKVIAGNKRTSNRDQAFFRGFNNITASGGRNFYHHDGPLYAVWLAGRKVKRYQVKQEKMKNIKKPGYVTKLAKVSGIDTSKMKKGLTWP